MEINISEAKAPLSKLINLGPVIKSTLDRLGDIVLLGGKTLFPFPMEEKSHDHQTLRSP